MKRIIFILSAFAISTAILAQTSVSGNQSGIWTAENSPYEVNGNIIVPAGETLTIEANVEVNFQAYYKFKVQGELQINGAEDEMVLFTTDNQSVGWGGVHFDAASAVNHISYCKFQYGKTGTSYPDMHGGAIKLINSDAVFENCIFEDNDATGEDNGMGGAVYGINTGGYSAPVTKFTNCKFINNHCFGEGGAIKFSSDYNTEIKNCEFIGNNCKYGGGAISFYSVVGTKMISCLFAENYTMYSNGGAIHMLGMGNEIFFENCTFWGNEAQGGDAGAVSVVNGNADFTNCIVYDNPGTYSDDVYIGFGGSADINYCNLTMPDYATGSNNIEQDPLFVNTGNDFHLQSESPCIDAGTDVGLPFLGEAPDMGCFEFDPVGIIDNQNTIISIYPNPTAQYLTIDTKEEIKNITLFDVEGREILNTHHKNIDFSSQKRGNYILQIETAKNTIIKKIVKK